MKYIILTIVYIVAMWLTIEASTAITKKLYTLMQIRKQLSRFGIKGKIYSIAVEKEEKGLFNGMLNSQKAVIVGTTAIATDICTLSLTLSIMKNNPMVAIVFVAIVLLCVTLGQRLAVRKFWAVDGCSKLIALSAAKTITGTKILDSQLYEMRDCADNCKTSQKYNSGTKEKMESLITEGAELFQSK